MGREPLLSTRLSCVQLYLLKVTEGSCIANWDFAVTSCKLKFTASSVGENSS